MNSKNRTCHHQADLVLVCLRLSTFMPDTTWSGGSVLNVSVSDTPKSDVKDTSASYSVSDASPVKAIDALLVVLLPGGVLLHTP